MVAPSGCRPSDIASSESRHPSRILIWLHMLQRQTIRRGAPTVSNLSAMDFGSSRRRELVRCFDAVRPTRDAFSFGAYDGASDGDV